MVHERSVVGLTIFLEHGALRISQTQCQLGLSVTMWGDGRSNDGMWVMCGGKLAYDDTNHVAIVIINVRVVGHRTWLATGSRWRLWSCSCSEILG